MNKKEILLSMRQMVSTGEISANEVLGLLSQNSNLTVNNNVPVLSVTPQTNAGFNYGKLLTYLGMIVVFTGIILMFSQVWADIGSFMRIFITLGFGFILYVSSIFIAKKETFMEYSALMQAMSVVFIPFGFVVLENEMHREVTLLKVSMYAFLFTVMYGVLILYPWIKGIARSAAWFVYTNFSLAFYYVLIAYLIQDITNLSYRTYILLAIPGAVYLLTMGVYLKNKEKGVSWLSLGLGSFLLLGLAFALQNFESIFSSNSNVDVWGMVWELLFVPILMLVAYVSVVLHSRLMFSAASFFLVGFLIKISYEYFSGLGGPLVIMISGLLVIAVGFFIARFYKKFFQVQQIVSN